MHTHLEKRIPEKDMARFYRISVTRNLFGEWTLLREWGRIGRGGQVRIAFFVDKEAAEAALEALKRTKERRGYIADSPAVSLTT